MRSPLARSSSKYSRIALAAVASLGVAVLAVVASTTQLGCQTHQCDSSNLSLDAAMELALRPGTSGQCGGDASAAAGAASATWTQSGSLLIWESSPVEGNWFCFKGNETVTFTLPPVFANANIVDVRTDVGTSVNPWTGDADTFANASGNLAEVNGIHYSASGIPTVVLVNATCQIYWAHVIVEAIAAPVADAGDLSSDASDGGDASADAE